MVTKHVSHAGPVLEGLTRGNSYGIYYVLYVFGI